MPAPLTDCWAVLLMDWRLVLAGNCFWVAGSGVVAAATASWECGQGALPTDFAIFLRFGCSSG